MENLQLLQLQEPCPERTKVAVDDDASTMSQKKDQLAMEISASTSFCIIICLITCNYYNDSTCFADTKPFFGWSNIKSKSFDF